MSSCASWSRSCPCRCSSRAGCTRAEQVREAFEQTGAAGVLLARGSLGNPWLFEQVLGPARVASPTRDEILASSTG